MTSSCYTCKIPITHSDSMCILNSEWLKSEINLLLLHDNQAWSGKLQLVENEDITELLEQLSLSRDEFVEESRSALTTHGGAINFTYTLENDHFIWKKYVRKNVSVKFGNINLLKVPLFEAFEKVIENTIHENLTCFMKLQSCEKQREILEKENRILGSKLNEFVVKKEDMEKTLYSQFLHLLNEKKLKIKELQKKIPAEGNEDVMQSESDHFNSNTEIDSEEEEKKPFISKLNFKQSNLSEEDKTVIVLKKTRKKIEGESIAGPSTENSKVVPLKRQAVKGKKGLKKSGKDNSVMGKIPLEKAKNLSEESEDAFRFPKRSKRSVSGAKPVKATASKIKYESDDDTDLDEGERLDCVRAKTTSYVDQTQSEIEPVDFELMEKNGKDSKSGNQETDNQNTGNTKINDEQKDDFSSSECTTETGFRGLSTSTLKILNQLV